MTPDAGAFVARHKNVTRLPDATNETNKNKDKMNMFFPVMIQHNVAFYNFIFTKSIFHLVIWKFLQRFVTFSNYAALSLQTFNQNC